MEGIDNPLHFPGADWLVLAMPNRNGVLWVPVGYPENLAGVPTNTDNWLVRDLGVQLQRSKWHKMHIEVDYANLEYTSFSLEGHGINISEDLSGNQLEYSNYAPFDKPNSTVYTIATESRELNKGTAKVYFDDVEAGIYNGSDFDIILPIALKVKLHLVTFPLHC